MQPNDRRILGLAMLELLETPPPSLSLDEVSSLAIDHFGLEGPISLLGGERDLNVRIDADSGQSVVKVAHCAGDELPMVISALNHIRRVDPDVPVPRTMSTVDGEPWATYEISGSAFRIAAFSYVPGDPLPPGPLTSPGARTIGIMVRRLQRALQGFIHPAAVRRLPWDARHAADLIKWTTSLADRSLQPLVETSLSMAPTVAERLRHLPAQVIHHDLNRGNLLVDGSDPPSITGVLDFGDMVHGARIQGLAVATAYALLEHAAPLEPAVALLGGYLEDGDLDEAEIALLRDLVTIRLAQSLTISAHRSRLHPDHAEYILADAESAATTLDQWLSLDPLEVDQELRSAAGHIQPAATADLMERRVRSLWTGLRMAYSPPLHLVSGRGVWLEDASGRQYLDAYNNVPHVGYGNRRVIAAATAQAKRLNTNTRYLTDPAVALAEAITERLPKSLSVCLLVNSGSEATDLAWRIARTVTGHDGAITTDHAYHGWTDAIYAISPEERPAGAAPPWHSTMAPPHRSGATVDDALRDLAAAGHEPAAIWFDTTFSSDGIADPSASYVDTAAAAVRARGGLVIADEVQAGLGRVGNRYWGFAAGTTVPDIIALGKPLGNGYPIGAVITTAEIGERFAARGYFFSTFGGNPVSAAAASMVLRITDELDLPELAELVGAFLRSELTGILGDLTGDVAIRGAGTFIGADVGDAAIAAALVDAMRSAGVLVGRTGPEAAVIKIRPPLVFGLGHAERLLEATQTAVRAVSGR